MKDSVALSDFELHYKREPQSLLNRSLATYFNVLAAVRLWDLRSWSLTTTATITTISTTTTTITTTNSTGSLTPWLLLPSPFSLTVTIVVVAAAVNPNLLEPSTRGQRPNFIAWRKSREITRYSLSCDSYLYSYKIAYIPIGDWRLFHGLHGFSILGVRLGLNREGWVVSLILTLF